MKRRVSIIFIILNSFIFAADVTPYFGVDYYYESSRVESKIIETSTASTYSSTVEGARLKAGFDIDRDMRIQGYAAWQDYFTELFSGSGTLNIACIELINYFDSRFGFEWFLGLGFHAGGLTVTGYDAQEVFMFGSSATVGISHFISDSVEMVVGVDFKRNHWDSVSNFTETQDVSNDTIQYYLGLNWIMDFSVKSF